MIDIKFEINFQEIDIIINIIKIFFLAISTYYIIYKITNEKIQLNVKKSIFVIIELLLLSVICTMIKMFIDFWNYIIVFILLLSFVYNKEKKTQNSNGFLITCVSVCINYIIFAISILISFFPSAILKIDNDKIILLLIFLIQIVIIKLIFNIKKFKYGVKVFQRKFSNQYIDIVVLNISMIILILFTILMYKENHFMWKIATELIVMGIIMYETIKRFFQIQYQQNNLFQELNETKAELENKKKEIEKLEQENLSFSKTSHSLNHKQKILEHKINELIQKNEIAEEMQIKDKVEKLSKELYKEKETVEITKTGVPEIDDILSYMQEECIKNKIEFNIQIIGNIFYMTNNIISKENLQILLADHIKDAIIAINHCDNINRSILVKLGKINDSYGLYIYDSGIEFEQETLEKLGKVPITTHLEEGGTGMGFMNTFDTLKKYKASLIIEQYGNPSIDNYTKVIMIKFDKKENFKVI